MQTEISKKCEAEGAQKCIKNPPLVSLNTLSNLNFSYFSRNLRLCLSADDRHQPHEEGAAPNRQYPPTTTPAEPEKQRLLRLRLRLRQLGIGESRPNIFLADDASDKIFDPANL